MTDVCLWYPDSLICKIQRNSCVRSDFHRAGDRTKTHLWFSKSLDSVIFLSSLGPYTTSINTVSQQLPMFKCKINEQSRSHTQKKVVKFGFLNSHRQRNRWSDSPQPKTKNDHAKSNEHVMPNLHSCLQMHLSVTTSLSQSLRLRSSEILIFVELLVVDLDDATAFSVAMNLWIYKTVVKISLNTTSFIFPTVITNAS